MCFFPPDVMFADHLVSGDVPLDNSKSNAGVILSAMFPECLIFPRVNEHVAPAALIVGGGEVVRQHTKWERPRTSSHLCMLTYLSNDEVVFFTKNLVLVR